MKARHVFFVRVSVVLIFAMTVLFPNRGVVAASAPQPLAVNPSSGTGMSAVFSAAFSDASGTTDLNDLGVLINGQINGLSSCWINYNAPTNSISMASDDTLTWSSAVLGTPGTLSNSQCSLDVSNSSYLPNGTIGNLRLALTFTASFAGAKNIYLRDSGTSGLSVDFNPVGTFSVSPSSAASSANTSVLTGVHWPSPSDFGTLKTSLKSDFAVVTVNPGDPATLQQYFNAAQTTGIKLIIGAYPSPYTLNSDGTTWSISSDGISFLNALAANASLVQAVFVFNEPYWTNDAGSQTYPCGNLSSAQLRTLRTTIQSVWPGAKIYHDIGDPTAWAPGGAAWTSCVGNKYQDQSGEADYVGIWYYPFSSTAYSKQVGLNFASRVSQFVLSSMAPAKPVFLAQSFSCAGPGCAGDGGSAVMPSSSQILDWNCSVRSALAPGSLLSWYVWKQSPLYPDYLANHPESWTDTSSSSCAMAPTPTPTPTATPTPSANPTASPTPTSAPTPTPSVTPTPAPSATPSPTPSPTAIPTPTPWPSTTPVPTPTPTPTPTVINLGPVTPNAGSGSGQIFQAVFVDSRGTADLTSTNVLIASSVDGANACWIAYDRASNSLSLSSDDTTQWYGPSTSGTARVLYNSQCNVNVADSSAYSVGNSLILDLDIAFKAGFAGSRNVYLRAAGSAGNVAGYTQQGTWTVAPTNTLANGPWTAQYYASSKNNKFANLKLTRTDAAINFDWGLGAPDPSVSVDNFAARWTGLFNFPVTASYTFRATTDDGMRIYIDGVKVLDKWFDQSKAYSFTSTVAAGVHSLKVEYYEHTGSAKANVTWSLP